MADNRPVLLQTPDDHTRMALQQMVDTQGWKYVSEYIDNIIDMTTARLISNKFKDISEVHRLQQTIETLRNLRVTINKFIS